MVWLVGFDDEFDVVCSLGFDVEWWCGWCGFCFMFWVCVIVVIYGFGDVNCFGICGGFVV